MKTACLVRNLFAFTLCGAGLMCAPAFATGFLGANVGWQYYGGGQAYNPGNGAVTSGTFTVSSGIGGTFADQGDLPVFNILADDSSITFDYMPDSTTGPWTNSPLSLAPTIDNGIAINLLSDGIFSDVSLDPDTNMTGFGASDFSFTDNQIEVNWATLPFNSSTIVKLDVTVQGSDTPEPASGALAAISLLGFAAARGRRLFR
jgi:hypothetical protein